MLALLLLLTESCGYRMAEEDKYPTMPLYPSIQADYIFDSLTTVDGKIKWTEEYMYVVSSQKTERKLKDIYLLVFDKNIDLVKKIDFDSLPYAELRYNVDVSNNIYAVLNDNKVYKYSYPWTSRNVLPKIIDVTQIDSLKLLYADQIKDKQAADPNFFEASFIDSIFNTEVENLYKLNDCVLPITIHQTYDYVVLNDSLGKQSYGVVRDYS